MRQKIKDRRVNRHEAEDNTLVSVPGTMVDATKESLENIFSMWVMW